VSGDGTGAGAQVDHQAVVREQGGGMSGQLLALGPGDIDARRHVERLAAEQERIGDPGRRLTPLPPAKPRLERGRVGGGG
jgi:hypothetical protein